MGRSGDTMVCGLTYDLHTDAGQCRSGRSAIPCGGCASCSWASSDWVADCRDAWAIHGLWMTYDLHTDAGQCRSGRSAIPCGGCVVCSWASSVWVADCRDAPATPWFLGWLRLTRWCRSVPLGTLCDTMRWCTWSCISGCVARGRDAPATPWSVGGHVSCT